ncbi:LemA family protein [Actinoplanes sp. NEAU-A12]|uniref:LemA family protein n=1 Tax=Actinoplanes sandaracinus TaxID=3045177 RepID=A0ABT6WK29_9ACTN|nr:LemA family protein [Actinoplanes sandaracinus]MDI6100078.1 LemA family protein [Actinoplanes sandaracinus]
MTVIFITLIALIVLTLLWAVVAYNRLVRLRTQVEASWAQIHVQLKRRHSLVPNLVETVRGYATHELQTFAAVTAARQGAEHQGGDVAARATAENALTSALGRLIAVAEAYPQLAASASFRDLQGELANTEDKIAYARQFYNLAVQKYNGAVASVPTSLIAAVTGQRARQYFEATGEEQRDVRVQF